jgi:hypothetical protein
MNRKYVELLLFEQKTVDSYWNTMFLSSTKQRHFCRDLCLCRADIDQQILANGVRS